jgi:Bacterial regulatory proteins, lacI family
MARTSRHSAGTETVTLRTVAERVGLAPCSVSAVLNNSPAGRSIPQPTRDRVWRAVQQLNYRPNYSARSLRTKRTYTVALLAPDIGHPPAARVVAGAEDYLRRKGYCLLIATYDQSPDWLKNHFTPLRQRGVEGIITLQSRPPLPDGFPAVFVDLRANGPMLAIHQHKLEQLGRDSADSILKQIEPKRAREGGQFAPERRISSPSTTASAISFSVLRF